MTELPSGSCLFLARGKKYIRSVDIYSLAVDRISTEELAMRGAADAGEGDRWPELLQTARDRLAWVSAHVESKFAKARRKYAA